MKRFVLYALVVVAACFAAYRLQRGDAADAVAATSHETRMASHGSPSPVVDVLVSVLGGFRGILAEVVWFRVERLQDEGRFGELVQLSEYLTLLEPHTPDVWAYAAWNLAYNVSVMMPALEDRWRWVEAAVKMLRDDGLRLNPRDPVLHRELAWAFLAKLGGNLDEAAPLYRAEWKKRVEQAQQANDWSALKMTAEGRAAVDAGYGKQDWRDPLASALYWAHAGLPFTHTAADRFQLRQIIYQSLMLQTARDATGTVAPHCLRELERAYAETPTPYLAHLIERFRDKFLSKPAVGPLAPAAGK